MTATPAGATCKHSRCTRMQPSSGDVARNAGPVDSSSISYIFQPGGARNGPASCSSGPPAHALMRAPHKYRMLECLEASRASTQAEARPGQREPNASRPARPERPGRGAVSGSGGRGWAEPRRLGVWDDDSRLGRLGDRHRRRDSRGESKSKWLGRRHPSPSYPPRPLSLSLGIFSGPT